MLKPDRYCWVPGLRLRRGSVDQHESFCFNFARSFCRFFRLAVDDCTHSRTSEIVWVHVLMIYARRTAHHQAVFVMIEFRFVDPKRRLSFHVTTRSKPNVTPERANSEFSGISPA